MAGLTVIEGGPGSGKTARLVALAAERYRTDPFAGVLVLTPTARHADQFRRRLVDVAGVAFGLDVTTFGLFAARHAPQGVASTEVAQALLARVTRRVALGAGPASRFRPILDTPGLHALLGAAVADLAADAVEPSAFARAASRTTDLDLHGLAEVYAGYRAEFDARGWREPRERAAAAAAAIGADAVPPLVLIDGAQFLRAGEVELVAALSRHSEVWLALDPEAGARAAWTRDTVERAVPGAERVHLGGAPPAPALEACTAADDEAQLREIARSIKQRLTDDRSLRPSDFAVVFRRVSPHLAAARRVFQECGLPLDLAAGERLAARPFGVWVLRLLRLGVHGWRLLDALDACASGFCDWRPFGFESGHIERLRRLGRSQMLWSGEEALRRLSLAAHNEAERRDVPALGAAAEAWSRLMDTLVPLLDPSAERTPGEHARLVDEALFGASGLARAQLDGYDALAVETEALRAELRAVRAVDETLGAQPLVFQAFVDELEARMQRPTTLIREAGGVLLAPMHTLHGLRFRHLHLAGLSEGEFPAPSRTGTLLDREARAALAEAGLALPPEARATEDELWRGALSRAESGVTLWRARLDAGGRPAAASYYFESAAASTSVTDIAVAAAPERAASSRELAMALARGWPSESRRPAAMPAWELVVRQAAPVEQRRRSFASAGRHEGVVAGGDTGALVAPDVLWSASRLEAYRTCPFQFFGKYALRLSELDEEQPEADPATRGLVMHEMLEDALAPLVEQGQPIDEAGLAEACARLRTRGRAIWEQAPEKRSFGRGALWRFEADAAIASLEAMLTREAEISSRLGVTRVLGGERRFERALPGVDPPMQVQGTVDRIDEAGDNAVQVVDYKTGRPIPRSDVTAGRRLQLQLYALLARAELGASRVIARYAFLRPASEWLLDSAEAEDAVTLTAAAAIAGEVRESVAAGAFEVGPRVPACPTYCSFRTVCRVNHFSRNKWS